MAGIHWKDHIYIDREIHHGDPCVRGTRIPVRTIVASLADGMTPEEVREAYPQLSTDNILGALAYAAEVLRQESIIPLVAEAV
jgi:uncharacterized protein (DUF433 family)